MTLLDKIQQLCEQKGITIYKLEQETDLTKGSIRKWDTSSPSSEKLLKVSKYFGVSMESLIDGSSLQNSKTYMFVDKLYKVTENNLMMWKIWNYDYQTSSALEDKWKNKFDLYAFDRFDKNADEITYKGMFYTIYKEDVLYVLIRTHNKSKDTYTISFFIMCNDEITYYASDDNISFLENLYQLVKTKVVGVDDLIDEFLQDDFQSLNKNNTMNHENNNEFEEITQDDDLPF